MTIEFPSRPKNWFYLHRGLASSPRSMVTNGHLITRRGPDFTIRSEGRRGTAFYAGPQRRKLGVCVYRGRSEFCKKGDRRGSSRISRFWHLFGDPKKRHFFAISEGSKIDFLEGMSKTSSGTPFSEGSKTGFHIRSRAHSVVHETHKLTATFDPGS